MHLRVSDDSEDEKISDLITMARELVEADTGLVIGSSTWTYKLDEWPADYVTLPLRPVPSLTSIVYVDTAGTSTTWSASNYSLDTSRVVPVIFPAYQVVWPSTRDQENSITVTMTAGYATAALVPKVLKQLVLLAMSREYGDREGMAERDESMGYERLLTRYLRSSYP